MTPTDADRERAERLSKLLDKRPFHDDWLKNIALALATVREQEREECAKIADGIHAPKSIGRDHGRHHEAGGGEAAIA